MLPSRPPRRPTKRPLLSRRELLFGGLVALGTGVCGLAGLGTLFLLPRPKPTLPTVHPTNTIAIPTATPEPPPIVARETWGALPPDHNAVNENGFYDPLLNPEGWRVYETPLYATYQTVIIHHSAFYEGDDAETLLEVQRAHREDRGWADVGYHFMVGQDGQIYAGRDMQVRGTHVESYNTGSLGVCLLGNFLWQVPTEAQLVATQYLLEWLKKALNFSCLAAHKDFNELTVCPGDNLYEYVGVFAAALGVTQGIGCYRPPAEATPTTSRCSCGAVHT